MVFFLRLTELVRMSDLVSLALLKLAQMAYFEIDASNIRARKGKRELQSLKQGDFFHRL